MNFTIRKGEKKDMSSILGLINELAVFEKEPNAVNITVDDLLENGFKEKPEFNVLVAEFEGDIVGMALFYNRFSTWDGPSLHLEDLIVTEEYRSKGIGKALYNKVLEFGLTSGKKRVEWVVLDWNTPAIEFYKSTGAKMLNDWNLCQMDSQSIQKYLEQV
jgi:GNAT superfamily N-acetyltransferase